MLGGRGISVQDLVLGVRLLRRLPPLLRHPLTAGEAQAILSRRLDRRQGDFLRLVTHAIEDHPASPYRALLRHAGCELGDVERLVETEGVEGALRVLLQHGVYLTSDEFKGRVPIVRGSTSWPLPAEGLVNPRASLQLAAYSSGSRGSAMRVPVDLAFIRDRAVDTCLNFHVRGGGRWAHAIWGVPGGPP